MPDVPLDEVVARRRRRAQLVVGGFLALVVTVVVAVALVYFVLLRFTPTAGRHVPANASVVMRVELQQLATYAPVRKHLWPVLFEAQRPGDTGKKSKPLAQRIEEHTGI